MTEYETQLRSLEARVDRLIADVGVLRQANAMQADQLRQAASGGGGGGGGGNVAVFLLTSAVTGASTVGSTWTPGAGYGSQIAWSSAWNVVATGVELLTANENGIDIGSYVVAGSDSTGTWWILTPDQCAHLVLP